MSYKMKVIQRLQEITLFLGDSSPTGALLSRQIGVILAEEPEVFEKYFLGSAEEWQRLALDGQKINAIKTHRITYGSDLGQAKHAVEDYMARHEVQRNIVNQY